MFTITHFRNSVVLFVCQSYRRGFVRFWSIDLQSTLTSAGVWEKRRRRVSGWQHCQSSIVLTPGAASTGARLEKVTLFGGDKQPATKLCFIWEEHLEGFQEFQINSICSSLLRWSK